jgi:hypothetical protein
MSKVLSVRVSEAAIAALEAKAAAAGMTKAKYLEQMFTTDTCIQPESLPSKDVDKCVCEGDKYPRSYLAKNHIEQKTLLGTYLIYPDERLILVRATTANGNKKWLEVAEVYSEDVWLAAAKLGNYTYNTLAALREAKYIVETKRLKDTNESVIKAKEIGWSLSSYQYRTWSLKEVIEDAEDYLREYVQV